MPPAFRLGFECCFELAAGQVLVDEVAENGEAEEGDIASAVAG